METKGISLCEKDDGELIAMLRAGNEKAFEELVRRYSKAVSAASSSYFSDSLTADDWFQEGMLGFLYAVHSFDTDGKAAFSTYSSVCIRNRLNSSWRRANNNRNAPLNESVTYDEAHIPAVDSPEEDYIKNERYRFFTETFFSSLSASEQKVLSCYLAGFSYSETAEKLGMSKKAVDNAVFRAKNKLKKAFNQV